MSRSYIDYRGVCGDHGFRPDTVQAKSELCGAGEEVVERELRPVSLAMIEPQHCVPVHPPQHVDPANVRFAKSHKFP